MPSNTTNPGNVALPSNPLIAVPLVPTVFTFFSSGPRQPWTGDLSVLSLDAAITEVHRGENQVTEHPVEQGSDVTDNSRPKPDELKIEGFISGVPVGNASDPNDPFFQGGQTYAPYAGGRAKAAFDLLRTLRLNSTIFDVVTDLHDYPNMTIAALEFPRDAMTGDSLKFSATLKAIRIVSSQTVAPPTTTTSTGGKVSGGNQATATATPQQAKLQSLASKLIGPPKDAINTSAGN